MDFLLTRFRNLAVLLVVLMAQLILLAYQVKKGQDVPLIRVWSVTAITPVAKVLEVVRANTIGIVENYLVLVNVRAENRAIKEELGRLKMENQFLRTEIQTADRARALQAFQAQTPSKTLPSRIIGTGTGTNSRVVFIDQGSGAGVMKGMAVVTPDGIVGKVLSSYPTASQVLLITDQTFHAGVVSGKNRVHGTVAGLGQSKVEVKYVQNEEKVEPGEIFYTSGDDRIFPRGMPVGKVSVVREGKTFKEIFLVPTGLQGGLDEVLVVLDGVHQQVPEQKLNASQEVKILPPPPADPAPSGGAPAPPTNAAGTTGVAPAPSTSATAAGTSAALMTEADRLRERYKKLGEAQNHPYGDPSKPPNFNLDLNAPANRTPATAQAQPPVTGQPAPVKPKATPDTPGIGQPPPVKPKPNPDTPPVVGQPAPVKPKPTPDTSGIGQPPPVKPKPNPDTPPAVGQPAPVKPKPSPENSPITGQPAPSKPKQSPDTPPATGQAPPSAKPKPNPEIPPATGQPAPTKPKTTPSSTSPASGAVAPAKPKPVTLAPNTPPAQ